MNKATSNRIITTPSSYAKEHYLYVQETGTLQSIEPHVSKRDNLASLLFFIVQKGDGYVEYHGQRTALSSGDCVFINCLEEYAHESSKDHPWELTWVHFYGKEASAIYKHYCEQNGLYVFHPSDPIPFHNTLNQLFQQQAAKASLFEQLCHKELTDLVTLCYLASANTHSCVVDSTQEKILAIRDYMDLHFAENINLDSLSEYFYISKFHLSREFKKVTGATPLNYLTNRRINEAKRLLRFTKDPISSIAVSSGIPDVNYFTKLFSKYENMTPSAYRKKW